MHIVRVFIGSKPGMSFVTSLCSFVTTISTAHFIVVKWLHAFHSENCALLWVVSKLRVVEVAMLPW